MKFKDKEQRNIILTGVLIFLVGSVLFWMVVANSTSSQLNFFKAVCFIVIMMALALPVSEFIINKFLIAKTTSQKIILTATSFFIGVVFYYLVVAIINRFNN